MFLLALFACSDATLKSSDKPPSVTILAPLDDATFDPSARLSLCVQIDDEDLLEQLAITVTSSEGGTLWQTGDSSIESCDAGNFGLSLQVSGVTQTIGVAAVDANGQAGSAQARIVPEVNTVPQCGITSPADGSSWTVEDAIPFSATAYDGETSADELVAVLESDLDGELWAGSPDSGGDVLTPDLALTGGSHLLTLTVTDARGSIDVCGVRVEVEGCLDADADGFTTCDGDCDDADPTAYPGGFEVPDGADNDCNGRVDDDTALTDDDGDGWTELDGDCDDTDPTVNPAATETWYDGTDQDCDGRDDDQDDDGYPIDADCDDTDPDTYPGAPEVWYDGIDQDCAGGDDDDQDGDGYTVDADCDDTDPDVNPGETEIWYDGTDQDCDGNDTDRDEDGYAHTVDCDDTAPDVNPGATEVWYDGTDQDCDGNDDDRDEDGWTYLDDCDDLRADLNPGAIEVWYDGTDQDCDGNDDDQDGDGWEYEDDCDDTDATVSPSGTETRDGLDNDCDDLCDEGVMSAGELVITEIMKDPTGTLSDTYAEYFEVYNASAITITMCGWEIADDDGESITMTSEVVVYPGEYALFVRDGSASRNGGLVPDYTYNVNGTFQLGNSGDEIVLSNDGVEIDRVNYTTSFPNAPGYSLSLDPTALDASSNDAAGNWCAATSSYYASNYGTPGAANDACP